MANIAGQTGTVLEVDAASKAARAILYDKQGLQAIVNDGDAPAVVSGIVAMGVNDRSELPTRVDRIGGVASALHLPHFFDSFENTTFNPVRWTTSSSTMNITQTNAAGVTLNSTAVNNVNAGYLIQTTKRYIKTQRSPLQARIRQRIVPYNNSVMNFGLHDASTFNGVISTGAYWQVTASGVVQPVLTFNSVDQTGSDIRSLLNFNNFYIWDVILDDDFVTFTVQDSSTGLLISKQVIRVPATAQRALSSSQLPLNIQLYNTASAPATGPQIIVSDVYVAALDADPNKPWPHVMAGQSRVSLHHPHVGSQTAQWSNSAEPGNASLSNTAAGYTLLGGKFQFIAPAGAATDYALFAFSVPAPSNFMMTGIDIEAWNIGAAVATTPTLLTWALSVDSTAASLATVTVNRIGLGAQDFPVGAAIGARAQRISKSFQTPLHCGPTRILHVILRVPVGTATPSQVIAGMVNIEGYWD